LFDGYHVSAQGGPKTFSFLQKACLDVSKYTVTAPNEAVNFTRFIY
jgi:hypothetical protein